MADCVASWRHWPEEVRTVWRLGPAPGCTCGGESALLNILRVCLYKWSAYKSKAQRISEDQPLKTDRKVNGSLKLPPSWTCWRISGVSQTAVGWGGYERPWIDCPHGGRVRGLRACVLPPGYCASPTQRQHPLLCCHEFCLTSPPQNTRALSALCLFDVSEGQNICGFISWFNHLFGWRYGWLIFFIFLQ